MGFGNYNSFILAAAITLTGATAVTADPYYRYGINDNRTTFSFSTGLRDNEFDWNIASDLDGVTTPNILSELTWSDIRVFEIKGKLVHIVPADIGILRGNLLLEAEAVGGRTVDGDNQDSDYFGDDRTLEFSRSNNNANRGYSYGGKIAAGYQFNIAEGRSSRSSLTAGPVFGYGFHRQEYVITEGNQTIPDTGRFTGLDSEYTADWYGPFVGLQLNFSLARHMLNLRGEHHILDYDAEAEWNLRPDFAQDPSFTHEADDATGLEIQAGYAFALDSFTDFTLDYTYQQREAEDGIDKTFFSDGTSTSIHLNEVNDESHGIRLGIRRMW